MTILKKLGVLAIVGLAVGASACSSSSDNSSSTTTTAATSTTAKETTTTEGDDTSTTEKSTTKVTKPAKIEKIDPSELPTGAANVGNLDISEEEQDCVYTVLYEYSQDPSNATDDATLSGVMGGAMAACVDQGKLASIITDSVASSAPNLDSTQLSCLENEIASADTDSLALFLGSFIYEGEGAAELQQPFIEALDQACGLSS